MNDARKAIDELTPEQEALIPVYRDKWRKIALSTDRIDREKAAAAIRASYKICDYYDDCLEPQILFFQSPNEAFTYLVDVGVWGDDFEYDLDNFHYVQEMEEEIWRIINPQMETDLLNHSLWDRFQNIRHEIEMMHFIHLYYDTQKLKNIALEGWKTWIFRPEEYAGYAALYDFCISVLNCECDLELWQAFKSTVENCGWMFDFGGMCCVCNRPTKLSFDSNYFFHAEGEPAIQFSDGFSIYGYRGWDIPEKYGKVHPSQWKSEWIIEEEDPDVVRVLIRGISSNNVVED